jgi:hypothetical protein
MFDSTCWSFEFEIPLPTLPASACLEDQIVMVYGLWTDLMLLAGIDIPFGWFIGLLGANSRGRSVFWAGKGGLTVEGTGWNGVKGTGLGVELALSGFCVFYFPVFSVTSGSGLVRNWLGSDHSIAWRYVSVCFVIGSGVGSAR